MFNTEINVIKDLAEFSRGSKSFADICDLKSKTEEEFRSLIFINGVNRFLEISTIAVTGSHGKGTFANTE